MKKNISLLLLAAAISLCYLPVWPATPRSLTEAQLAQRIFGSSGLNFESTVEKKATIIFNTLLNARPSQIAHAAQCVAHQLQDTLHAEEKEEKEKKKEESILHLFFNHYVIEKQIEHLNLFAQQTMQSLSLWQRLQDTLESWYHATLHWFWSGKQAEPGCKKDSISQAILDYLELMRTYVLSDYNKLLRFLVIRKKVQIPAVIDFWADQELQNRLIKRVIRLNDSKARVQFFAGAAETVGARVIAALQESSPLLLQAVLMSGGSMYSQWLNSQAEEQFARLLEKQKQLSAKFDIFMRDLQENRKKIMTAVVADFIKTQSTLREQYQALNRQQQAEVAYLMQSINLNQPKMHYLVYPIPFDQLFAASIMLTPASKQYPWYNIYQNNAGDWAYDQTTNSFWQRALTKFGTPYWDKGTSNPESNAIFTEFISPTSRYQVQIECVLANVTYPFFAGIIVNRARWISGDPERLTQYRLIGFYGTQANEKDVKSRTITLNFAQQQITNRSYDAQGKLSETIISPLQQIATNQQTKLWTIPTDDVVRLVKEPLRYRFDLTIEPTTVTYQLWQKDEKNQDRQVASGAVNNLANYIAIFGGIGFVASGCQASFKLLAPTPLAYTQQQITDFQAMLTGAKK